MNNHEYPAPNDVCLATLDHALRQVGIHDGRITDNGGAITITTTGTKAATDQAMALAACGSLYCNKITAIEKVDFDSNVLALVPVAVTVGGVTGMFDLADPRTDYPFYLSLTQTAEADPSILPEIVPCINGGLLCSTVEEVRSISTALRNRLDYIYTSSTPNADGSHSKLLLISAIMAAADQEALDAIEDTRQ